MLAATPWWQVVSAVGAAAGAIAAAVGAGAAWRAANASRATSRDALEALAVGIRPRLDVDFAGVVRADGDQEQLAGDLVAEVSNISEWPATDLSLEVGFRDGRIVREQTERLAAPTGDREGSLSGEWRVAIRPGAPIDRAPQFAVLRYSDDRRIARYEVNVAFFFNEQDSRGNAVQTDDQRIR